MYAPHLKTKCKRLKFLLPKIIHCDIIIENTIFDGDFYEKDIIKKHLPDAVRCNFAMFVRTEGIR